MRLSGWHEITQDGTASGCCQAAAASSLLSDPKDLVIHSHGNAEGTPLLLPSPVPMRKETPRCQELMAGNMVQLSMTDPEMGLKLIAKGSPFPLSNCGALVLL